MAVAKVCTSSFGNLGSLCDAQNGMTAITGLILTTNDFEFASYTDFADQTKFEAAIKNKTMFPLMGALEYDDNTEETPDYESPLGVKLKLRDGKYSYKFRFNLSIEQHKELQKFSGGSLRYFLIDSTGNIYGYSDDGVTVKGFSISTFEAEKMTRASADAPAWSSVSVTESNATQWNGFGVSILPDWVAEDLSGLANVNIGIVGTPTSTELVVSVGAPTGRINSDGSVQTVPITGIESGDFVVLKASDGSSQTVTFTDNDDGTYTGVGSGLETGTVNLKSPSLMSSGGTLIESTGAASFTV